MGDLSPRPGGRLSRRDREQRAYLAVVVGGGAALVAAVGFVLALIGVIGAGLPLLATLVAIVCFFLFRRSVGR